MRDYSELIGQKINEWDVLDFDYEMSKRIGRTCMKCRCSCGTIKGVRAKDLANNKSLSCGCLRRKRTSEATFKDLTGQRFGRLLVLEIDWEKTTPGRYFYKCLCDCGTIVSVEARNLRSGMTNSCGCLRHDLSVRPNKVVVNEEMDFGACFFNTVDQYFLFDLEDLDIVKAHCWRNGNGYARTSFIDENGEEKSLMFHRAVMERKYGDISDSQIDHQNHYELDNRKDINLRICNREQNQLNRKSKLSNIGERNISYNVANDAYAVSLVGEPTRYFKEKQDAIDYRDQYYEDHPNEFYYNPDDDWRNRSFVNSEGKIYPFFVVTCHRPVISPFTIVDEDKFNNSKI